MQRYLYFRTQATDADDDDSGQSACWPASSLMGMHPSADSTLALYFKPIVRRTPSGNEPDADEMFDNHDRVLLTLTTANTHLTAMKAITHAITTGRAFNSGTVLPALIVVANDDSGGTEYLANSGISACSVITVNVAYAN